MCATAYVKSLTQSGKVLKFAALCVDISIK